MSSKIENINTPSAPAAIGPYSQAIRAGNFIFLSGQIPIEPQTGIFLDSNIETQTRRVLDNLAAVLNAAGSSFDRVVKVDVFLRHMSDYPAMNAIYAEKFNQLIKPARQVVEVSGLPKGALIEISCVAIAAES
jgi:2-iminobutanoate/2-iminopropanoate deaminase